MPAHTSPRAEYESRLAVARARRDAAERTSRLISHLRLASFAVAAGLAVAAAFVDRLAYAWALPPLAVFIVLIVLHERAIRTRDRAQAGVDWYARGIARIDHTWQGTGCTRSDFVDEDHPYSADLDLFGSGSLLDLLCTARTRAGEQTLARWLTEPATADEIRARQAAVAELRDRVDLREDLALLADGVRSEVHPDALAAWGARRPIWGKTTATAVRVLAWTLAVSTTAGLLLWGLTDIGPLPFFAVVVAELIAGTALKSRVVGVLAGIDRPERELVVMADLLERLEREPLESAKLTRLATDLGAGAGSASHRIARLRVLVTWLDARRNQLFAPAAAMWMWGTHFATAIEAWRTRHGGAIARWFAIVGEFEALLALSAYAYEHPTDPFPEIVEDGPRIEGEALGHPLLAESECVRNSVTLDARCGLWVVSGSNMSGKTTFLRVIGTAVAMAQAGAPVRAERLRLSPLAIGATIRVHDSLAEGRSRFYAEITRIRRIVDLTREGRPVLFLLDEILHGTNSHDRRIGAEAIVNGLLAAGAVGLVTTHDLALAEAADAMGDRAKNVHFDDRLVDGVLAFDYRLKPGVVTRSNALELMRSIGLEV